MTRRGNQLARTTRTSSVSSPRRNSDSTANGHPRRKPQRNGRPPREETLLNDDELAPEELETEVESTDDPVRMYLMQMGEIPLLNRAEEIQAAQEIEKAGFKVNLMRDEETVCGHLLQNPKR